MLGGAWAVVYEACWVVQEGVYEACWVVQEGVTTELAMFESLRESAGEQELNLSKDTVLLKYLLEPSTAEEAWLGGNHMEGTRCDTMR